MAQRPAAAGDVSKTAVALARAMTIGLRSWSFYPPEHPAVALAVDRLIAAATDAAAAGMMQLAVTPHALLIDGLPLESNDLAVAECAGLLHDRDILQLTVTTAPADAAARALLTVLSLDRQTRRARGGPAVIWGEAEHTAFLLEQIDYQELLEREAEAGPTRRDATWQSIVRSIIMGRGTFTADEQTRMIEISRDAGSIGELCKDSIAPYCMPDGSPMLTTQAATVLAVYRHLARTVAALEPERVQGVIDSMTLAANSLEPSTTVELLLQNEGDDATGTPIVDALKQSFDDQQVALLLARAVSSPGQAMGRLAHVLHTLAPDAQRKRRILTLARKLIGERDFGGRRPLDDVRRSLDDLLLQYDESRYVSADYRESMAQAAARAGDLAARGLPPEMPEWLATLGHDSVRRLSGQLLIDLLRHENEPGRMRDTARDMAAFVEELLLAGVYAECLPVIDALADAAGQQPGVAPDACRRAIAAIGASSALAEAAAGLGEQSAGEFTAFEMLLRRLGPGTMPVIIAAYAEEDGGTAMARATHLLGAFGAAGVPPLIAALDDPRWFVQREIATALGRIGTSAAVPPLLSLLRRGDVRVIPTAVAALAGIADASAVRALHTGLKASAGEARAAVIASLVTVKDARVAPMLTRILQDGNPFGDDHPLILDALHALAALRDERAVPAIAALARQKRWLSWRRTFALRDACLRTLRQIGSAAAGAALTDLAVSGDFLLRRRAAAALEDAP
jgi:HEAT repeat protein